MTGKLKALGLALFVALAVGAVAAQVGSAGGEEHVFTTTGSSDETVLTGEQKTEGISHHEYTEREEAIAQSEATIEKEEEAIEKAETEIANFHEEVESLSTFTQAGFIKIAECTTATYTASFPEEEANEFAAVPEFSDCGWSESSIVNITNNGCTFRFEGETTENPIEKAIDAPFALVCEEGGAIEIEIVTLGCHIDMPSQEELHGVAYENLPEDGPGKRDALQVAATVGGVTGFTTGGFVCELMELGGMEQEHNNFGFEGMIVFTGYEGEVEGHNAPVEGDQVDFAVE